MTDDALREELYHQFTRWQTNWGIAAHNAYLNSDMAADLLAWHARHTPPRPTREQITQVIERFWSHHALCTKTDIVDALLALWPATTKRWCSHIEWVPECRLWRMDATPKERGVYDIDSSWDQCPVAGCHAPRPA